jgi:hypothetical protein
MSMDKPFDLEVSIDAPRDAVWRALTEPERIRHWFAWEHDGLDDEIRYIFVEHAEIDEGAHVIRGHSDISVFERDGRTVIRAVKPGDLSAVEWKDVYGGVEEGWITFFNQLRHRLERGHAQSRRRMIVLKGELPGVPALPGSPWHRSAFQAGAEVDGALLVVFVQPSGEAMGLVTTYDLDDDAFAAAEARWSSWWRSLA